MFALAGPSRLVTGSCLAPPAANTTGTNIHRFEGVIYLRDTEIWDIFHVHNASISSFSPLKMTFKNPRKFISTSL